MTLRRGYLNVAHDILTVAVKTARITEIVYRANLNFNIAKRHLADLVDRGLIVGEVVGYRRNETANRWTTTDRGREFLHRMETVLSLWDVGQGSGDDAPEVVNA